MHPDRERELNRAIGFALTAARKRAPKLSSYDELVAATGISESTIGRYMNGKRAVPLPALFELADAMGVPAAWIIARAEMEMEDRAASAAQGIPSQSRFDQRFSEIMAELEHEDGDEQHGNSHH